MEFDFIWIAIGIAVGGYFIGNGLQNFQNPGVKSGISDFFDDDDEHELIKENDVHYFIGISKEDTKHLLQDHPDIPHIIINEQIYYPKAQLRKWLLSLGK